MKGLNMAETEEAAAFIEGSGRRRPEMGFGRRERDGAGSAGNERQLHQNPQ